MTKIIICIPTYNRADQICSLFKNLQNQYDQDFTVVILNDGANTMTRNLLKNQPFKFNYHFFESTDASGLPCARNKIINYIYKNKLHTDNTYLAFLDDDLIIKKDFISKIRKYSRRFDGFCFRIIQRGPSTTFDFTKKPFLQTLFTPVIGKILPLFGSYFGGFYIKTAKPRKVDHINGGCLIYNFSKNIKARFDSNLNEGNFVAEDTCFSYGLTKNGNSLYFISTYSYIHNPPNTGGCKIKDTQQSFYWYWKHKLYIFAKYHKKILPLSIFFCFLESILLSVIFRTNLTKKYLKATKTYAKNINNNGCL